MDINQTLKEFAILAPPFLMALTVHEFSHGYVAYRLGDPTARLLGRLTLNPLKHLDLLGTIAFFIMRIGWAKPVPIDARYFKNPQRDLFWVSLAGIGANLVAAIISGVLLRLLSATGGFLPIYVFEPVIMMLAASVWINIMLAVFNLIPIPPLDGSKVLMYFLPSGLKMSVAKLEPFGFIILLILFYSGVISKVLVPLINFANGLIVG